MVLDNAAYHKSKTVRAELENLDGVELIFLPPYAPQLNPAEGQVAFFKRRLAGRYFGSKDALKGTIEDLVSSKEVRPSHRHSNPLTFHKNHTKRRVVPCQDAVIF